LAEYRIEGGRRLSGAFRPAGNKNAALPALAATMLTRAPVTLENMPEIGDIHTLLRIMQELGVEAEWTGPGQLRVCAANADPGSGVHRGLGSAIRGSVLLAGAMLARFGRAELPVPGGDFIGRRRLDTHFLALRSLGANVEVGDPYRLWSQGLKGTSIFLDEPSVTGTENAVLAAVTAEGVTVLRNAAQEPHVEDLCRLLVAMGARIHGIGTNCLTIEGVRELGGAEYTIGPDHIEIGSMIGLAAATKSDLAISGVNREQFDPLRIGFTRLGIGLEWKSDLLLACGSHGPVVQADLGGEIPKIDDGPWPAFPADLTSVALVAATQCRGTVLIHEKMFESRLFFVDHLVAMGARIVLCDPHRAVVTGPAALRGARLESPDIRAGMAMVMAALAASGESRIGRAEQVERGYARLDERLRELGAAITRMP